MAVARPIRMLSAACVVFVIFMVFQMNKGTSYVGTGSGPYNGMKSDPLKESTSAPSRDSMVIVRVPSDMASLVL